LAKRVKEVSAEPLTHRDVL